MSDAVIKEIRYARKERAQKGDSRVEESSEIEDISDNVCNLSPPNRQDETLWPQLRGVHRAVWRFASN
jgi:hypothetical protein